MRSKIDYLNSDEYNIQRYEDLIKESLLKLHDDYMNGYIYAKAYAEALKQIASIIEDFDLDDSLTESYIDKQENLEFVMLKCIKDFSGVDSVTKLSPSLYVVGYNNDEFIISFDLDWDEYVYTINGVGPFSHNSYEYITRDIDQVQQLKEENSMTESLDSYKIEMMSDIVSGVIDNMRDIDIDKNLKLVKHINKELNCKNPAVLISDDYDPAWVDFCYKLNLVTKAKGIEKYIMQDKPIMLIHERRNGLNYLYFANEQNAEEYVKAYDAANI